MIRKVAWGTLLLLTILAVAMLLRAATLRSRQLAAAGGNMPLAIDATRTAESLALAIRFRTISDVDLAGLDSAPTSDTELARFRHFLELRYPHVHAVLSRESVGDRGMLYTWNGSEPAARPVLLLAHLDVVPIESATEREWKFAPFSGEVAEGYVWGRGALDNKVAAIAILESIEWLLDQGFAPRRTVYVAFGADEEVGGYNGAAKIADLLRVRNVRLEYVLDEGAAVVQGIVPGIAAPVALVGIAEKGYLSVELSVEGEGGHSSMPPRHTAVGILSAAITRLEDHPMPAHLDGAARLMLEYLAPEMPLGTRTVLANLWLFGGLLQAVYARDPTTNAQIRTTTAATMFAGSPKDNVLPTHARAVVNFRILPGDHVSEVLDRVRTLIDDPRVKIAPLRAIEPSATSAHESPAFMAIARTIQQTFPNTVVAPSLVVVGTDSRHYAGISENVYRFLPVTLHKEDLSRIHGTNERVSLGDCMQAARFYIELIRNTAQ